MTTLAKEKREPDTKRLSIKRLSGDIILLYRLIEERSEDLPTEISTVYSLSVTKIDCGGGRREIGRAYDISRNEKEAYRIFRLISRGKVTPCCLHEIIEEIIST